MTLEFEQCEKCKKAPSEDEYCKSCQNNSDVISALEERNALLEQLLMIVRQTVARDLVDGVNHVRR